MTLNVLLWILMIVMIGTSGVLFVMTCIDFRREVRASRRVRSHLDPAIRGEIEQTMEWWDGEFRKLWDKVDPDARLYRESKSVYSHLSYVHRSRGELPVYRSVKGRTYAHTHGNRDPDPQCEACQAYLFDLEKRRDYLNPYRPAELSAPTTAELNLCREHEYVEDRSFANQYVRIACINCGWEVEEW